MKKRIFNMMLVLCLLLGMLPTAVFADSSQTGTVVWFDKTKGASGQTMGYAYAGDNYFAIGPGFSTTFPDPVVQVGQTVQYDVTNGITLKVKDGSLSVKNSNAMSISISGDEYVGKTLTIDVSNIPSVGSVSIQLYQAVNDEEIFNDGNKLGEAVSYSAGTPITHTVTSASIGKFIGAKATYTVKVDGTEYTTTLTARTAKQILALASGSCGENLTWEISGTSGNYNLTISGTGAMTDYDSSDNIAPWLSPSLKDASGDQFVGNIKSLVLSEGITHIGSYAFSTGSSRISIQNSTFPSTLLSIGEGAFMGCYANELNLSLTLPNGLTTLGTKAFGSCLGITEVILPVSLTTVGEQVFHRDMQSLAVYCLAGSVEAVPDWANSLGLTNSGDLATISSLTYHAAVEPTCVTAGAEEYYAFEGDGVSENMASRYYNAQKIDYTNEPTYIQATGIHTMDETGKCSVCQQTYDIDASVKIGDGAAVGYTTMTDALKAANAVGGSETVTVMALKSRMDGYLCNVTLDRTAPIVLDLGGYTVASDNNVFTMSGATVTVKNGTLKGSHNSYVILVKSGTLNLESSVTLQNTHNNNANALYVDNGTVNVNGATIKTGSDDGRSVIQKGGTLNVNDGVFSQTVVIYGGNTTLKGGSFAGIFISVTGKTVGGLLDADCGYKTAANAWVSDAESLGGVTISSVTVDKFPVLITAHPQNASVVYGNTATLSVTATGAASYKWLMSGDASNSYVGNNDGTFAIPSNLSVGTYYFYAECIGEAGWSVNSDTVTVTVTKAAGVITNVSYPLRYVCSGEVVEEPIASQITTNGKALTFKWFDAQGTTGLDSAPSDAGTYTLRATSEENANYKGTTKDFTVTIVPPVVLSARLSQAKIDVSVKNNTVAACEYSLYCATYNTNGKMLTIAALDGQNTPSGKETAQQFTMVTPSSATHAKVFAIKGNLSPLAGAVTINLN